MPAFTEIARLEGMQRVYQVVVGKMNPTAHPDFLQRPVKVLDIGGGTGEVGKLLKLSCEVKVGTLCPEDFAQVVDYVNLDTDRHALAQSVGRAVHGSIASMFDIFKDEEPFDYILNINPNPEEVEYDPQILNQRGVLDPIKSNLI